MKKSLVKKLLALSLVLLMLLSALPAMATVYYPTKIKIEKTVEGYQFAEGESLYFSFKIQYLKDNRFPMPDVWTDIEHEPILLQYSENGGGILANWIVIDSEYDDRPLRVVETLGDIKNPNIYDVDNSTPTTSPQWKRGDGKNREHIFSFKNVYKQYALEDWTVTKENTGLPADTAVAPVAVNFSWQNGGSASVTLGTEGVWSGTVSLPVGIDMNVSEDCTAPDGFKLAATSASVAGGDARSIAKVIKLPVESEDKTIALNNRFEFVPGLCIEKTHDLIKQEDPELPNEPEGPKFNVMALPPPMFYFEMYGFGEEGSEGTRITGLSVMDEDGRVVVIAPYNESGIGGYGKTCLSKKDLLKIADFTSIMIVEIDPTWAERTPVTRSRATQTFLTEIEGEGEGAPSILELVTESFSGGLEITFPYDRNAKTLVSYDNDYYDDPVILRNYPRVPLNPPEEQIPLGPPTTGDAVGFLGFALIALASAGALTIKKRKDD